MESITQKRNQEVIQEFAHTTSWQERYKKIINIGKASPPLATQYKTPDWLVKGCQSQVWLYAQLQNKKIVLQSDSDALITKGLVRLLVKYYSNRVPDDILKDPLPSFLKTLDLQNHLTPTRASGLLHILKQIRYYAQAFTHYSPKEG